MTPKPSAPKLKTTAAVATQCEVEGKKRSLPQFKSKSLKETKLQSQVEESDKPIFAVEALTSKKTKLSRSQRRAVRKGTVVDYEADWYYFLLRKFMLVERSGKTMQAMKNELSKYIAKFDTTLMTGQECYVMMVRTVTKAMSVPEEEIMLRQAMKDSDANDERRKHQSFVKDGLAGKSGFSLFGKTHSIPKSTP
jgi:hypothetical protein